MEFVDEEEVLADAVLARLVMQTKCKPGWKFNLSYMGTTLFVVTPVLDSRTPDKLLEIEHRIPVPAEQYSEATWTRWLFEWCRKIETHELGEWFEVNGERPFFPPHGPGEDPYTIVESEEFAARAMLELTMRVE